MLLDAAYLPPAPGLEPAIVLFGAVELSPGAWRRATEALDIPETARRLTLPVGDPAAPRFTQTRALAMHDAVPYLMSLSRVQVRPSVNAWVIAAHVAQRIHEGTMLPRGEERTDAALTKVAASMPDSSCSVLVEISDGADELLGGPSLNQEGPFYGRIDARDALNGFLDMSRHALTLGSELRQRPKRGSSRTLAALTLRLHLPSKASAPWLLDVRATEEASREAFERALRDAAARFQPLADLDPLRIFDPLELDASQASTLILATDELRASGATIELPSSLMDGLDRQVKARLRFRSLHDKPGTSGKRKKVASRSSARPARFRLDDLVAYDLDVALGGADVDARQLRELARRADSLVKMGDDWIALTDSAREQLERLARAVEARDAHMANSHALAASLAGTAQLPGGLVAEVERVDDAALGRAIEHLREPTKFETVAPPSSFTGTLRGYQQAGLTWLAGMESLPLGACLADDMGLGKTVQIIALLEHIAQREYEAQLEDLKQEGADPASSEASDVPAPRIRALVICPTSLIGNWERELNRFAPDLSVLVHHGPSRAARMSHLADVDIVVTSYGLVARDRAMLGEGDWDVLVFDEAQSVKNPDTEQARAVRSLRGRFRVALTGTPIENRLLELWAILDLLNPGLLGSAAAFNKRFAGPIERIGDEQAATTLRHITRPFLLRRVKHDPEIIPDLPDKQEQTIHCTLTPEQAALYQTITEQALSDVRHRDGIARRGAVLALLTRLKQVCNHPAQALRETDTALGGRSGKLDRLESMLGEVVDEGDRALVFTQYAQMGGLLARHLPEELGCEVLYLHGGVPRAKREELVARFQDGGDDPIIFVLSLKVGGLGLNLMGASHVFHYDRWWNPAVEDQATDRTHRIGQTRRVQVHKLVCAGTLEERIAQVIDEKRALAGRIIEVSGGGEGWITELGDTELEELVTLAATSTAEYVSEST